MSFITVRQPHFRLFLLCARLRTEYVCILYEYEYPNASIKSEKFTSVNLCPSLAKANDFIGAKPEAAINTRGEMDPKKRKVRV